MRGLGVLLRGASRSSIFGQTLDSDTGSELAFQLSTLRVTCPLIQYAAMVSAVCVVPASAYPAIPPSIMDTMDVSQKDYCSECRVPGTKPPGPKVNIHAIKHQALFSNLTRDITYAIITEIPQSVPEHIHQLWSIAIYIPLFPVHRFRPTNAFRLATTSPSPGTNLPIPHVSRFASSINPMSTRLYTSFFPSVAIFGNDISQSV